MSRRTFFGGNIINEVEQSLGTGCEAGNMASSRRNLFSFDFGSSDAKSEFGFLPFTDDFNYGDYANYCKQQANKEPGKEYFTSSFEEVRTEGKISVCRESPIESTESGSLVTEYAVNSSYMYEIGEKPTESYAYMIYQALISSQEGKLTLSQIYNWIETNYSYYRSADPVWKNSIRHNLSLNQTFVKIPRPLNSKGKGGYWAIDMARCQFSVHRKNRRRSEEFAHDNMLYSCK